jgi:hypothetical protein
MLKTRSSLDRHMRRAAIGLLALAGAVAMQATAVYAEGETPVAPADETPAAPQREAPADEKAKSRLEALQRQHDDLEFQKRTKAPFTSEQSLRHQLRRNEAQQGWQKGEQRRLEYEQLRQERDSRTR